MSLLAMFPPTALLFALAVVVMLVPQRIGHAVAVLGGLVAAGLVLAAPAGGHLQVPLFGFDAVLYNIDVYSRLLGVTFGFIASVGVAYAFVTGGDRRQTAYALAYTGSGLGAALAGDWLSLVVFWELMAVFATLLIWHRTSDHRVGIRYAIYHEIGALALIAGVLLHYAEVGTFLFGDGIVAGLPALLVALGIGLNAGFVGLHVWLVESYSQAHVATSAVLAAITTKVGAYAIVRAFPEGHAALAYVGGAMVLFGVTFAILQTDMRRLLSYHIISQVGYMVAGFGAGAALAQAGAMAHLVNNVLYKSLLFMVAGVIIQRTGKESLKKLGNLRGAMPIAAIVFLAAAFSITGIPGFNGFVSKGMVLDGVEKAGFELVWYALLLGGVGTVISFAKFGYYAFFHGDAAEDVEDLNPLEIGTLGTLAALCLLLGVVPGLLFNLLPAAGVGYAKPFAGKQFFKAGGVTIAGLVAFALIRGPLSHVTPVSDLDSVYTPLGRRLQAVTVEVAVRTEQAVDTAGRWLSARTRAIQAGDYQVPRSRLLAVGSRQSIGVGMLAVVIVLVLLFFLIGV